jgi:uncharacterized protein (DUF488 family)
MSNDEARLTVFTIGHSTRTLSELMSLLKTYGVTFVADVRTIPRSRHNPQFNKETLPDALKADGIGYLHMPELGGFRRPVPESPNMAWENKSFRGYADYIQTREFVENLLKLMTLSRENCLAVMCSEAMPWRCHRSLIADALVVRHFKVKHILNANGFTNHALSPSACVEGTRITYPLFAKEKSQRTLADFGSTHA